MKSNYLKSEAPLEEEKKEEEKDDDAQEKGDQDKKNVETEDEKR